MGLSCTQEPLWLKHWTQRSFLRYHTGALTAIRNPWGWDWVTASSQDFVLHFRGGGGGGGWWESEGNFKGPGNEIGFQTNFFLILYVLIQCTRRMWTHFHFWRPKLKLDPATNTSNLFIFEHIHIRGNLGNKPRDCLWSTKTGKKLFQ